MHEVHFIQLGLAGKLHFHQLAVDIFSKTKCIWWKWQKTKNIFDAKCCLELWLNVKLLSLFNNEDVFQLASTPQTHVWWTRDEVDSETAIYLYNEICIFYNIVHNMLWANGPDRPSGGVAWGMAHIYKHGCGGHWADTGGTVAWQPSAYFQPCQTSNPLGPEQ